MALGDVNMILNSPCTIILLRRDRVCADFTGLTSGDLDAMMGLSKWYLCGGEGFPPDEEKAYYYADLAATAGLPQAEFAMGNFIPHVRN